MLITIGDVHLGAKNKYSLYFNAFFEAFDEILKVIKEDCDILVIAGDLFHNAEPDPATITKAQSLIDCFVHHDNRFIYILPGNHDIILPTGYCAADTLDVFPGFVEVVHTPRTFTYHSDKYVLIPYSEKLKEDIADNSGDYLISHFSTKQMSPYAGIFDEDDPIFDNYENIIVGDYHSCYRSSKFISTGSTFPVTVDECLNKNGHIYYSRSGDSNEPDILPAPLYPDIINIIKDSDEIKNTEETINVLLIDNDEFMVSNKNILIKRTTQTENKLVEGLTTDIEISEESLTTTQIINMILDDIPELSYDDKKYVLDTILGLSDIEQVVSNLNEDYNNLKRVSIK
jgi:DNA repair exonuclease SbcCD nuclease subunit